MFQRMLADSDHLWTLKPCLNCEPSAELDTLIRDTITQGKDSLHFKPHLKPLICKHGDTDERATSSLLETLLSISSPEMRFLAASTLIKVNKAAKITNLMQLVNE